MNDLAEIKFPYLYRNVSRHGTERWYVRKPGQPLIRLPGDPRSKEFADAYHAAKDGSGEQSSPLKASPVVGGSLRALWVAYSNSPEFQGLAKSTKDQRRRVMDLILHEPISSTSTKLFADGPAKEINGKLIRVLRDRKKDVPEAANHRLKLLRQLFAWGCENDFVTTNPVRDVKALRSSSDGHHTWTVDEVVQYLRKHPKGSKARLAIGLMLFLGVRISDLSLIGPQHIRDGVVRFVPYKTRERKRGFLELPVLPGLKAILEQSDTTHMAFMVTEYGKPFSIKGLGQWFKKRCKEAGLPHCSAHGLRKAGATIGAENGATEEQLKAIYGWENAKEANLYTRKARQSVIADGAMALIDYGETVNRLIHLDQ